jgi:hypothetical protein
VGLLTVAIVLLMLSGFQPAHAYDTVLVADPSNLLATPILAETAVLQTASPAKTIWQDNFESYPCGSYPGGWYPMYSGVDQSIDCTVHHSGSKSFHLLGNYMESAVSYRQFPTLAPIMILRGWVMVKNFRNPGCSNCNTAYLALFTTKNPGVIEWLAGLVFDSHQNIINSWDAKVIQSYKLGS